MRWASPVTQRWLARRAHGLIHFKLSLSVYEKWWADNEISVRLAEISESGPLRSFLCEPFLLFQLMWILCNENALVNEETASLKGPITLNCLAFFFCAVPRAAVRNGTEFNIPGMQFLS